MCIAIPGKVLNTDGIEGEVDFMGTKKKVRLDLVDAKPGDWVIVHAGTAIEIIDQQAALETIKLLEEYFL